MRVLSKIKCHKVKDKNTLFHLYVKPKQANKQTFIDIESKLVVAGGEGIWGWVK